MLFHYLGKLVFKHIVYGVLFQSFHVTPQRKWDKVPILIVSNPEAYSAEISFGITLLIQQVTEFRLTVAYFTGNIVNQAPDTDLRIYVENSTHENTYALSRGGTVYPGETLYVYINARIASLYEREYLIQSTIDGKILKIEPTQNERIREYVLDVEVHDEDDYAVLLHHITHDGEEFGEIMTWFYNGTKEEKLILPNSLYLNDGILDVGEYVYFGEIFKHYDEYHIDFEIGTPIGAIGHHEQP